MKLLLDENISPRVPRALSDLYPGSLHVRDRGLTTADDAAVWEYARTNDCAIVSKDSDCKQRSLLYGHPPKFIWIRLGNCSTDEIKELLRKYSVVIHTFHADPIEAMLMLP